MKRIKSVYNKPVLKCYGCIGVMTQGNSSVMNQPGGKKQAAENPNK